MVEIKREKLQPERPHLTPKPTRGNPCQQQAAGDPRGGRRSCAGEAAIAALLNTGDLFWRTRSLLH